MVDARFSALASIGTSTVAVLAALGGATVVAIVWAALAIGFAARALLGCRR
jgi:hypothetical protein